MWVLDFALKREALKHWFISDINNTSNILKYSITHLKITVVLPC